jgi:protein-S-isoprenylcysteine O-methyltransferase Ste14
MCVTTIRKSVCPLCGYHVIDVWTSLFGLGDALAMMICQEGSSLMIAGAVLIIEGWKRIYRAGKRLVTDGIYAWVRHPQ